MIQKNCLGAAPIHEWDLPSGSTLVQIPNRYERVDSIMITNLVTVCEDDLIDFADTLMKWHNFHHLPVENSSGEITGIISARDIDEYRSTNTDSRDVLVHNCMTSDIITVTPETSLQKAETVMLANGIGSMPVVRDNRVIGIVTANDIRNLQRKLELE